MSGVRVVITQGRLSGLRGTAERAWQADRLPPRTRTFPERSLDDLWGPLYGTLIVDVRLDDGRLIDRLPDNWLVSEATEHLEASGQIARGETTFYEDEAALERAFSVRKVSDD